MLPFKKRMIANESRILEMNQERMISESLLNQRISLFLILFAIVIVGAVTTQKKILFVSIVFVGTVLSWVLAYAIFGLARKIGFLVKELNTLDDSEIRKIDRKGSGRIVRLLLGYFVPLFCSSLLTFALLLAVSGLIDSYLWLTPAVPAAVESKIDQIKTEIKNQIAPPKENTSKNFTSVDSVILAGQTVKQTPKPDNMMNDVKKQMVPKEIPVPKENSLLKGNNSPKNFKNIDSVIVRDKPVKVKIITAPAVNNPKPAPANNNSSKDFKNIDNVISKEKDQ
jgi:hypothetical protein